jgi:protein-disulfide isomerase
MSNWVSRLELVATTAIAICAAFIAGLAVWNKVFGAAAMPASRTRASLQSREWNHMVGRGSLLQRGDSTASTLVVFTDYECPFCRRLEGVLDSVNVLKARRLNIVYRQFPLPQHKSAERAALVAICATKKGAFSRVHRMLFTTAGQFDVQSQLKAAAASALDPSFFPTCVASHDTREKLDADIALGKRLQLEGTPTVYVDGQLYSGPLTVAGISSRLRSR